MSIMQLLIYPLQVIVKVDPNRQEHLNVMRAFAAKHVYYLKHYDQRQKRVIKTPKYSYVYFTKDKKEFFFLRTMLDDFLNLLYHFQLKENEHFTMQYCDIDNKATDKNPIYPAIKSEYQPDKEREQDKIIEFITQFEEGPSLIHLTGGGGKSLTSMFIVEKYQERFLGVMGVNLIGKTEDEGWVKDFAKSYIIDLEKELVLIEGIDSVKKLFKEINELGYNPYKAMLMSNKTLISYINRYEENTILKDPKFDWMIHPHDIPKLLGVNTMVIDEAHKEHYMCIKLTSYLGVKRLIGATATPNYDDKSIDQKMQYLFPKERRYNQQKRYIHIQPRAWYYQISETFKPVAAKAITSRGYSHMTFEKNIMKRKHTREDYFKMVSEIIEKIHLPKLEMNREFKCLITVSMISTAKALRDYLRKVYPELNINSYVSGEPVGNLYNSDIAVSTLKGAGTGHDIPLLATAIMTDAIGSSTANLQFAWRLRKMKIDIEHTMVYLVCQDLSVHKRYDMKKKKEIFINKTKTVINEYYPKTIS